MRGMVSEANSGRSLFGSTGIRGKADELFTDQFTFDIGRSFDEFLRRHDQTGTVVVGRDPRQSSPRIKRALITGLSFAGREVRDEGIIPIPAVNYMSIADGSVAGGVMVTGSHIKAELNGLKFFALREEILKDQEAEIEEIYKEVREKISFPGQGVAVKEEREGMRLYLEFLKGLARGVWPKWKIVVDPGNGAQTEVMPEVLASLGVEVVKMNADLSEILLSRDTEEDGVLQPLAEKVKEVGADLGIAYDADGDRAVFVDEKGEFVAGDYSETIIAKYQPTEVVVCPVSVCSVIDKIGKKVVRTKVGSPYVVDEMKKHNAGFGFEGNGGGIFSDMLSRDGGHTTVEFLNILAASRKTVSELVNELPKYYLFKTKVDYKWGLEEKILEQAKMTLGGIRIEEIDGLKIWVDDDSWILFRSSQNAPEFRVFTQSKSREAAAELARKGMDLVKGIIETEG